MRVTQSMLSNNMLRNLNTSYSKMSKLQEQIESGSVLTRPSDDPVAAVKGMGYRKQLDSIEQYERNTSTANTWLDTTDEALAQVSDALIRVKELVVQASSDTVTQSDRQAIAKELEQLREQARDVANTQVGGNYIFSGTQTNQPLYLTGDTTQNPALTTSGVNGSFKLDVYDGISMQVNTNGSEVFKDIDQFMSELLNVMNSGATGSEIGKSLGDSFGNGKGLNQVTNDALTMRSQVGAKQNRLELMQNRLSQQGINITKRLSENEDTDYSEAITQLTTAESIHQASLSVGAKIIQQTLVDFI